MVGLMVNISVSTAPISTTNMTGLRHIQRGSSLRTDCHSAGIRMSELKVALRGFARVELIAEFLQDSAVTTRTSCRPAWPGARQWGPALGRGRTSGRR